VEKCGIKTKQYIKGIESDTDHYKAIKTRFYVCHIETVDGINQLICDTVSKRGTFTEQQERAGMYEKFRDNFNEIASKYIPESETYDYGHILRTVAKSSNKSMTENEEKRLQKEIFGIRKIADTIIGYLDENKLQYNCCEWDNGIEIISEYEDTLQYIEKKLKDEHIEFEKKYHADEGEASGTGYNILYRKHTVIE
jgi:hypothetical protein